MRRLLWASLIWLFSFPAFAADNAITVTNGSDVVLKSKDLGSGVQLLQRGLLDTAGAEILGLVTASPAANTIGARLVTINTTLGSPLQAGGNLGTITAVTAITNALPAGTNVIGHIICDSGCSGSGGTASTFGAAFPATGTAIGLTNGTNMVAWSATTNYGTAPAAIAVPAINAFITNTNANGSATSANSSPVVIASDQVAVAIKAASGVIASGAIASGAIASGAIASGAYASGSIGSGAIASGAFASGSVGSGAFASGSIGSGAIASGAIASGAIASGAVASGAYASGSLASGAVVDITNMSATVGAALPAKILAVGTRGVSGTTGGLSQVPITCDSHVFKHITSATDTLAVQGVASQIIYVCNWRSRAAGTATWYLENTASANANCSSTLTQLTGVASEIANTGEVYAPGYWQGLKNTSGNGLCINSTGTGGVDIDIWYAQF